MTYNIHKLLSLAEKFEKATKFLDKGKDKDDDKDKSGAKKRFPFWLKFKKKKVKSSYYDDLLLKYSNQQYDPDLPYSNEYTTNLKTPDRSIPNVETTRSVRNPIDGNLIQFPIEDGDGEVKQLQEVIITPNGKPNKYKNIDPKFQKVLGLNPDGVLGPVTKSALDAYKKSIGQENVSDEFAFEALKNETAYKANRALIYDENQNVYKSDFLANRYKSKLDLPVKVAPY